VTAGEYICYRTTVTGTSSHAVADRPRDSSCLSVVSLSLFSPLATLVSACCTVTMSRPSLSSSFLKITNRSFCLALPHLWNQLPVSFRQYILISLLHIHRISLIAVHVGLHHHHFYPPYSYLLLLFIIGSKPTFLHKSFPP